MKAFALGVLFAAGAFSIASAADFTVTLAAPVKSPTTIVRPNAVWRCDKDQCTTQMVTQETNTWQVCQVLAKRVGKVASYGTLDAAQLSRCNGEQQQASK